MTTPICAACLSLLFVTHCPRQMDLPVSSKVAHWVHVGFRGWNSSSTDCFGSLIRERSFRSFFCASSFCRKRKRGDRVACPDRPCLVMPKPFWPLCIIRSSTKSVRLPSYAQEPTSRTSLIAVHRNHDPTLKIALIVKRREHFAGRLPCPAPGATMLGDSVFAVAQQTENEDIIAPNLPGV
jgi:hypothetical protein